MKDVYSAIDKLLCLDKHTIIAIDGRCAAGKTTLAELLQSKIGCNVFHMDDFFLQPAQRTRERLDLPGGNVDRERFLSEVLLPLLHAENFSYRPYSCRTRSLCEPIFVTQTKLAIVEGAYSCHPELFDYYDLHIFVDVDKDEQMRRILLRNGADAAAFNDMWIPLEEKYFAAYDIASRCEIRMKCGE